MGDDGARGEDVQVAEPEQVFAGMIVALGASAGGLDALDRFFSSLPPIPDAAFVVIQHLAPEHKTMMDTLLARHTRMEVQVAEDDTPLAASNVYVIPPGTTMTVSGGRLRLVPRPATGITLPIDSFFESLALDAPDRAIGVVLSGTGSDGTRGAVTLHSSGSWVLAQDPETARFDGMPRSVIASGAVDRVGAPESLAAEVAAVVGAGTSPPLRRDRELFDAAGVAYEPVLALLGDVMRVDFSQYKPTTVLRRVERRMHAVGTPTVSAYAQYLAQHPAEIDVLRRELLIPVTSFFRDPDAFASLRERALVPLVRARAAAPTPVLRAWVAACATGEEAYSIAMLLLDVVDAEAPGLDVKVFATDVESSYVATAAAGEYSVASVRNVPEPMLARWFVPVDDGITRVNADLRRRIVFSRHDLLVDPPFTKLDLAVCRNALIYLRPGAQDRALRRLTYSLSPGGILFLGTSESAGSSATVLETVDTRQKIYRLIRRPPPLSVEDLTTPRRTRRARDGTGRSSSDDRVEGGQPGPPVERALEVLAREYVPTSFVITRNRELVHLFGDAGRLVRFRDGDASLDVLQLLPAPLVPVVGALVHGAVRDRAVQHSVGIRLGSQEEHVDLDVSVWPIEDTEPLEHLLVVIGRREVAVGADPDDSEVLSRSELEAMRTDQLDELERELALTRVSLYDSIQDLGTANEELQAANEELMASNEELQSTNEELQSVNEELHTMNAEYQAKIVELSNMNADLESLTQAIHIPLVFLDGNLHLTRFTASATSVFRFRATDLGRPITDFAHSLHYPDLYDVIGATASGQLHDAREVVDDDGRMWLVSVLPVVSSDPSLTRLVLTCVDVSSMRDVRRLQAVIDALPSSIAVLDPDGRIELVNRAWTDFAVANGGAELAHGFVGSSYLDVCRGAADDVVAADVLARLQAMLDGGPSFSLQYPCNSSDDQRTFVMHATKIEGGGGMVAHFEITPFLDRRALAL